MRADYRDWLKAQGYADNTQAAQTHRVQRVEQSYGSLEEVYENGKYNELISELMYSTADQNMGRPNPSKLKFEGNIRSNLQSYRDAALRYKKFLTEGQSAVSSVISFEIGDKQDSAAAVVQEKQKLSLERDMQAALRKQIGLLEAGLSIIDEGAERSVTSGFIDILCKDALSVVVVELKAGITDARVIGQILGYMGDLMEEDALSNVRGIIVAHEFDKRTLSAAKAVPNLKLVRYSVSFAFEQV